jgi:hypothetical protein
MKPLLVGEAPGPQGTPDYPLEGRPAGRLLECMGWTPSELEGTEVGARLREMFEVRNLLDRPMQRREAMKGTDWPAEEAAEAARALAILVEREQQVVLLGKRVAAAFGLPGVGYWKTALVDALPPMTVIPHPSGIVRLWNDPVNRVRAGYVLWQALGKINR